MNKVSNKALTTCYIIRFWSTAQLTLNSTQCVTLTFAQRNRLTLSLSGNKPLSAN